jgi:hypothetical protein
MALAIEQEGMNWCKKLNHEIDDFTVHVRCFTPCAKGCASCPEYAYKTVKKITLDCSLMKDAYGCLGTHAGERCDYAEAWEGAFFCHKPKGQTTGLATIEKFVVPDLSEKSEGKP